MMKPVAYFINTDVQIFWSSSVSVLQKFGGKLSYYYYWSFSWRKLLSKVSPKYCTCVINTPVVLTWKRPVETLYYSSLTCKLL